MSAESDALWLEAEAKWEQAVQRKVAELEGRAQRLAFVNLFADRVEVCRKEHERCEDLLAISIRDAKRALQDLDDGTSALDRMLRMTSGDE